jgi:prepilin-type N-terminal cleavage/methylation domain-containing protein
MKRQAGFTLVELAVVVFIIGLIASMSFATIKAQIINASIRTTQGNQNTIKDALVAYLGKNRRLPCPDTNFTAPDGIENRGATTGTPTTPADPLQACNAAFGLIPYQTLGLSRSVALDGWDNFFSYQVSNTSPSANLDWTLFSSFHEGNCFNCSCGYSYFAWQEWLGCVHNQRDADTDARLRYAQGRVAKRITNITPQRFL